MTSRAVTFHKPHVLVVEGKDDYWVCIQLLQELNIESVQVIETGGFPKLGDALKLYTKTPGWSSVERFAVLVDCDGDAEGRCASVRGSLQKAGLAAPNDPMVFSGREPAVAYCVVPPDGGCIEDLICNALADGSPLQTCVDQFVACCGLAEDKPSKRPKVWVHAYIAAKEPGLKIGEAARAGILRLEQASYSLLRDLLLSLQQSSQPQTA